MTEQPDTRRRLLVIGAGYVGAPLAEALAAHGHDVVATTTTAARLPELQALGLHAVQLATADRDALRRLVADRHAVFLTVAAGRDRRDYRATYVDSVTNLLAACAGSAVRQIIYTSSTSVYGQTDGAWVDEAAPTRPANDNGRVLVETEGALLDGAASLGITATILRLAGIYGPGRNPRDWLARYAGAERTDGEAWLNLVHRDDVIQAAVAALERPYHGVLNLAGDRPVRRCEFYDRLMCDTGLAPITWNRPDGPPDLGKRIRNDLAKHVLGLTLRHPEP